MITFKSVAKLKLAKLSAVPDELHATSGYSVTGDGGQATYEIQTAAQFGSTPDELSDFTLANGNIAKLQLFGNLIAEQFGSKGGAIDDTLSFDALVAKHQTTGLAIQLTQSLYTGDFNVAATESINLFSFGATTVKTVSKYSWVDPVNVIIKGVVFDCTNIADGSNGIEITRATKIRIRDSQVNNAKRTNFVLFDCSNYIIRDNEFNDAGKEQFINPTSLVNIGCGVIFQDCKQIGTAPTLAYNNQAANPWQIGFFAFNLDDTTESIGNVIMNNQVYGAQDNGIRTQTQGTPFDPFRCREHVVQGNYVIGSGIDNYRCNGGDNSFTQNYSFKATGYGMKSDGGSNNNMSMNYDNGSAVCVGLRIGADTINYAMDNNVSVKCSGAAGAIYGVIVENGVTVKNISASNNRVIDPAATVTPYSFTAIAGKTPRFKNIHFTNNFVAESHKNGADFKQVDDMNFSCNSIFEPNQTSLTTGVEVFDCNNNLMSLNHITPNAGTSVFGFNFLSGSAGNFGTSNHLKGFTTTVGWQDQSVNQNLLQDTWSTFTNDNIETFTVQNIASITPSDTIDAATITGDAAAVLGFLAEYMSVDKDFVNQRYKNFTFT